MFIRMFTLICGTVLLLASLATAQTETAAAATMKAEIQICTSVADRNPVGAGTAFAPETDQIFCWCRITGGAGEQMITHVWSYGGKVMAEVPLTVKGESWRTWSAKKILPSWTGGWEVSVKDGAGNTLATAAFTVGEAKN